MRRARRPSARGFAARSGRQSVREGRPTPSNARVRESAGEERGAGRFRSWWTERASGAARRPDEASTRPEGARSESRRPERREGFRGDCRVGRRSSVQIRDSEVQNALGTLDVCSRAAGRLRRPVRGGETASPPARTARGGSVASLPGTRCRSRERSSLVMLPESCGFRPLAGRSAAMSSERDASFEPRSLVALLPAVLASSGFAEWAAGDPGRHITWRRRRHAAPRPFNPPGPGRPAGRTGPTGRSLSEHRCCRGAEDGVCSESRRPECREGRSKLWREAFRAEVSRT